MTVLAFGILLALSALAYVWNWQAANTVRNGGARLHSLSGFHGLFGLLVVLVPVFALILVWLALQGAVLDRLLIGSLPDGVYSQLDFGGRQLLLAEIRSIASGSVFGEPEPWKVEAAESLQRLRERAALLLVLVVTSLSILLLAWARRCVAPNFRARQGVERIVMGLMIFCSVVAVVTTIGIVASLLFETIQFFRLVPIHEFLFGTRWEPQIAIRADQIAGKGAFGVIPVVLGTLVIMTIALIVAVPVGLLTAIFLNEFASRSVRAWAKPMLEILAGVPTVVYGFFALLVVAPALRSSGAALGIPVDPTTALAAGSVMGIMLIPFISSFADDALTAVPQSLRDGALALGATRGETMMNVLFPAALPGIMGGVLLAVSRAVGETMIVVMAAGLMASLTINPLDSVTTVTVQIVTLLIGDSSFDDPKTLAAFALGMLLFLITLGINIAALRIVRRYREAYE